MSRILPEGRCCYRGCEEPELSSTAMLPAEKLPSLGGSPALDEAAYLLLYPWFPQRYDPDHCYIREEQTKKVFLSVNELPSKE